PSVDRDAEDLCGRSAASTAPWQTDGGGAVLGPRSGSESPIGGGSLGHPVFGSQLDPRDGSEQEQIYQACPSPSRRFSERRGDGSGRDSRDDGAADGSRSRLNLLGRRG